MSTKRNILLVIETSGPGGAETVLFNTARNLDRSRFNPQVVLFRPGWFEGHLRDHGVDVTVIHSRRSWDLSFLCRLIMHCRRNHIDLIHSHLPGGNLYCSLVGAILRIPVVTTFHNEFLIPGATERHSDLKFFLIRTLASRMVLVAEFMRDDYQNKAKCSPEKLARVYNGIEFAAESTRDEIGRLRDEIGIGDDELVIGHVANFRGAKGHRYQIEAAGKVCAEFPRARFLLVGQGEGPLREEAEELIRELRLEKRVTLLGFREDVDKLLSLFDVFVLSSISEGLPLSVVEAMAASLPVVTTRVGGLPEIVHEGETGFLVEPRDSEALADRLLRLLRDPDLRTRMGEQSRLLAHKEFSIETMIEGYQSIYNELLG